MINGLIALFEMARPANVLMAFAAVVVGAALCGAVDGKAIIAAISASLILTGGNVLNDLCDIGADRVVHPSRPLPAGKISSRNALLYSIFLFLTGILASIMISRIHLAIAIIAILALFLYSKYLSSLPAVGNITIACLAGLAPIYGALAGQLCAKAIWAGIIAMAIHLPREIFKDIQDIDGDNVVGRKTLPLVVGKRHSASVASALVILAMILMVLPYLGGVFGLYYIIVALSAFILCGMALPWGLNGFPKTAQKLLKAAMIAGIIALLAEAVF